MKKPILFAGLVVLSFNAFAQGTAFTYQGRLNANGAPADGTYDLVFTVYASATGTGDGFANQTNSATSVSNGLFSVTLNLGLPGIFTGADRWLEIEVRTNGPGLYAKLSPRQKITATPYAITASNLSGTISVSQLSGAIPLAQLPAAVVTNNQNGVALTGTFSGNGSGLTGINPTNLAPTETEYYLSPHAFRDVAGLSTVRPDLGAARLSTLSGTLADMTYVLPLDVPSTLLGVPQRIKRVKIAYQVATNTANYIYFTRIDQLNVAMQGSLIASEFQTRSNQSPTTYTLTNNSGAPLTGTAYLSVYAMIQNASLTNYIKIGPVTVTTGP